MTASFESIHDLSQAICHVILSSFQIDADTFHFAQSTLGLDSSIEIRTALRTVLDTSNSELECLIDLLLTPSMHQREAIEPTLQGWDKCQVDQDELIQELMATCPRAVIAFPDGEQMVLDLDRNMMHGILGRLRLGSPLPEILTQAVAEHVPDVWKAWVQVRMRLASVHLTGSRADFLAAVLQNISASSHLFPEYFAFSLSFIQECTHNADMLQALAAKKEYLEHSIGKAAFLEKQRTTQAMETLLMQRMPMLSIDVAAAEREIQIINDISLALYGRVLGSFDQTCQESAYHAQRQHDSQR
jgi:hypothetical protein